MRIRTVVGASLVATVIVGCRSADVMRVVPDARTQRVQEVLAEAQGAVANAGCSLGLPEGSHGSRVVMLERNQLPFVFPSSKPVQKSTGPTRMKVVRLTIPLSPPRAPGMLACLVPVSSTDAFVLRTAVASTRAEQWEKLAMKAATDGSARSSDLARSVADVLLNATLKSKVSGASPVSAGVAQVSTAGAALLWGGDPQQLPTMTVTAYGNVVVFDLNSVMRFFGAFGESQLLTWEMQVAQQQWSQYCDQWNEQMDVWDATKDAVAAAANEEANDLESLAGAIQAGLTASSLETANASCKPTNGKQMCVDFFITNCAVGGFAGDCRDFDRNADYLSSRVQLYINPQTMIWEVKFNCSSMVISDQSQPNGNRIISTFCDSAQVFHPTEDVLTTPPDANGWRTVTMHFRNNACIRRLDFACPAIDAQIAFRPNAAADGGYELTYNRDGFPSMGVYTRNATDTGWEKVKEDRQKTQASITAIRALAGQIRSKGYNFPAPGGQPPGCYRY